jgi:hypothetical protein|tara:strand:- start:556 stop:732 length:177 start_codon:yes stop_codon:yes gene_type:complete
MKIVNRSYFTGILIGTLIGLLIGGIAPVYSFYSSFSDVCELNAGDLKDIVKEAIEETR